MIECYIHSQTYVRQGNHVHTAVALIHGALLADTSHDMYVGPGHETVCEKRIGSRAIFSTKNEVVDLVAQMPPVATLHLRYRYNRGEGWRRCGDLILKSVV